MDFHLDTRTRSLIRVKDLPQVLPAKGSRILKLRDLVTDHFIATHTSYPSWEAFVDASGLVRGERVTDERFRSVDPMAWDAWVRRATSFSSWTQMLQIADERR